MATRSTPEGTDPSDNDPEMTFLPEDGGDELADAETMADAEMTFMPDEGPGEEGFRAEETAIDAEMTFMPDEGPEAEELRAAETAIDAEMTFMPDEGPGEEGFRAEETAIDAEMTFMPDEGPAEGGFRAAETAIDAEMTFMPDEGPAEGGFRAEETAIDAEMTFMPDEGPGEEGFRAEETAIDAEMTFMPDEGPGEEGFRAEETAIDAEMTFMPDEGPAAEELRAAETMADAEMTFMPDEGPAEGGFGAEETAIDAEMTFMPDEAAPAAVSSAETAADAETTFMPEEDSAGDDFRAAATAVDAEMTFMPDEAPAAPAAVSSAETAADAETTFMPEEDSAGDDFRAAATAVDAEMTFMPDEAAPAAAPEAPAAAVAAETAADAETTFMPEEDSAGGDFRAAETAVDAEMTFMPEEAAVDAPAPAKPAAKAPAKPAAKAPTRPAAKSATKTPAKPAAKAPTEAAAKPAAKAPVAATDPGETAGPTVAPKGKTRRPQATTRRPTTRRPQRTRGPQTQADRTRAPGSRGPATTGGLETVNTSKALRTTRFNKPGTGEALFAGKYRILGEIARGGMGVVYRALQVDLNQKVALKVMLAGAYASKSAQRRFLFEAEASARLKHPNIVPVYDIGSEGEKLYFTMGLVSGEELKDRRSQLDRAQLLEVMIKVCDGVDYAHKRGIIHRDLKPGNVMMNEENTPLIMDFGLAKQLGDLTEQDEELEASEAALTADGVVMGTPHFMSPEQAAGRLADVDTRTDVYALGVMLYQLWTDQFPYSGTGAEIVRKILSEDEVPLSPRQHDPTIDMDLEAVILKAMDHEIPARYETAGDLKKDLEHVRDGLPVSARRATPIYRLRKWARRNRARLAVASAFLAVLAFGVGLAVQQRRAVERRQEEAIQATLTEAEQSLEAIRRDGQELTGEVSAFLGGHDPVAVREERTPGLLARFRAPDGLLARLEEAGRPVGAHVETHERAQAIQQREEETRRLLEREAERLAVLQQVHTELKQAAGTLERARLARDGALEALGVAAAPTNPPAWADLPAAIASSQALLAASREEGVAPPAGAPYREASDALDVALNRARQSLFTSIRLSLADAPEAGLAQRRLDEGNQLRAEVDRAASRTARARLARHLEAAAGALSNLLLDQPAIHDDAVRRLRLQGANLARELVQRALEADDTAPGLGDARLTCNFVHAQALLGLKAYKVFDVRLADPEAFRPEQREALVALRQKVLEETHKLRQQLESEGLKINIVTGKVSVRGAGGGSAATLLALKMRLGQLAKLATHPYMDDELERLRQSAVAKVQDTLRRIELKAGREKLAAALEKANAAVDAVPLAERPAHLAALVKAWGKAEKLLKRSSTRAVPEEEREAFRQACVAGRARLHHEAAAALAASEPDRARELMAEALQLYGSLPPEVVTEEVQAKLDADAERLGAR